MVMNMERKYYLRGLGLGIAVTAVIMGVIGSHDKGMTDQEIIARAKELGMVENTVLADMGNEESPEPANTEEISNPVQAQPQEDTEEAGEPEEAVESTADGGIDGISSGESDTDVGDSETAAEPGSVEPDEPAEPDLSAEEEPAGTEEGQNAEDANEIITSAAVRTITINRGDGSHTVAKKLEDAGVVTSADTFDEFLCRNGYDKKLRIGTFSIPADAGDEQIARIVTGAE